ncbi:sensor histidine kinase [Croceicoccus sediminis]|uniref:sensor histidine kinase n=1 Tax=Croceicoccus sediminis TaxID=2571150 RepID=UPI00118348F1|nr:HAMP domain-containing sensor histidine kinase [Croceicoccus sediminis]
MTQVRLFDSIFTRLVAWSIAVCIVVVLVLGALVGAKFEQLSTATQEAAVNADVATLAEAYRANGVTGLGRRINERLAFSAPAGAAPHYLLVDADGATVTGNVPAWPEAMEIGEEPTPMVLSDGTRVYARALMLAEGKLFVARESSLDEMILNEIGFAFVAGGLFVVFAVGVAGRITTARLSRRVDHIIEAFQNPDERRLERLSKDRKAEDEIGELTRRTSETLTRLNHLVDSQRETTDLIAHEMRTPLMHLDSRILKSLKTAPDDTTAQGLSEARADIRGVITMLESLLDISHSEAHRGDPRGLHPVDLSDLLQHVAEIYEASAEETGHHFEWDIAPNITFPGEEMQLTRLVTNLLDNAFKYVPTGGTVILSLAEGPEITVSDTGPGIPPEDRDAIFDRFRRAKGNDGSSGGSGLGLALARAIARRHGLDIRLKPTLRGATFIVGREKENGENVS